jgi:UDP-glucose 4-epimerase
MNKDIGDICIIGGGGFIGTALRRYFAAEGYALHTVGRSLNIPLFQHENYYSTAEYSHKQLERLLAGRNFFAVIDLAYASVPGTSYEDPVKDFSENLYNVIRHLDFASAVSTRKYIYVSSGGTVYGDAGFKPFSETTQTYPLSPYGITKLACERYVYMHHRLRELPAIIIRPSNIYGPGQKPFLGQGLAATALGLAWKGEPIHIFGTGSHVRDYLFIDDFCQALIALIDKGEVGETYNVGYGKGISISGFVNSINEVLQKEDKYLAAQQRPERPFDVHYNVLNIDKLAQATGWCPQTNLATGLTKTWQWIQQYMKKAANS